MSYWDTLSEAHQHLAQHHMGEAERAYEDARRARDQSPGRVFLSETMGNAARRVWNNLRKTPAATDVPGRWERSCTEFCREFLITANALLLEASAFTHRSPRFEDAAVLNQAVYLTSRSRLVAPDADRCVVLTVAALDAAARGGWLPPADLMPPPGFLASSPANSLAVAVLSVLESRGGADSPEARALAETTADLLMGGMPPDAIDAVLMRRLTGELLDQAQRHEEALVSYDEYLSCIPEPSPERDRVQLRAVCLLANIDEHVLPIPRYQDAQRIMVLFQPDDPANRDKLKRLSARMETRTASGRDRVWATVDGQNDLWWIILWHADQPFDVAWWSEGMSERELQAFLAPCRERVLSNRGNCPVTPWDLGKLRDVLTTDEPDSAPADFRHETVPVPDTHPSFERIDAEPGLMPALAAGRNWWSIISDLVAGAPALRAGLHALARAGDEPSRFVAAFLPPELVPSTGWPHPSLKSRSAPDLGRNAEVITGGDPMADLAQADYAVVTSGRPGRVLASWGARRGRWRLVLDQAERLTEIADVLQLRGGKLTILPFDGFIDDPQRALDDLDALLASAEPGQDDVLPLLHWIRICRTHNGDLGDTLRLKTDKRSSALSTRYLTWLAHCRLAQQGDGGVWREELAERVAMSDVVVGTADWLLPNREDLAKAWGVDADRPAAWMFCDATVLFWRLARRDPDSAQALHRRIKPYSSATLLVATSAVFMRADLEDQLADWLEAGEAVLKRAATDVLPPLLELGSDIPVPGSRIALADLVATLVDHARTVVDLGRSVLWALPNDDGPLHSALKARANGVFGDSSGLPEALSLDEIWAGHSPPSAEIVVVPRLESLDLAGVLVDVPPDHSGWRQRDRERARSVVQRRRWLALEINAWLARGGETVVVTDSRWWRDIPIDPSGTDNGILVGPDEARRAAAGDAAILRSGISPSQRGGAAALESRRWLQEQGWIEEDGLGLPSGWASVPAHTSAAVTTSPHCGLHIGPVESHWFETLRSCWLKAEAGRLDDWLLVVTDSPPPGADHLAAAFWAPRNNAPAPGDRHFDPAPLVWVTPDALGDPSLRRLLAAANPTDVWVSDLRRWLPSDHGAGQEFVGALGFLLRDLQGRVRLHACHLPAPWRDTLVELLRRRRGAAVELTETENTTAGEGRPIAVIRCAHVEVTCPGCQATSELRTAADHCPVCGLNLLRWQSATQRQALPDILRQKKVSALVERETLETGDDHPLCVWIPSREMSCWTALFDAQGIAWRRAKSRSLSPEDRNGNWLICLLDDQPAIPAECRHVLLVPPQDQEELADLRQRCAGELSLWFHPLELELNDDGVGRQDSWFDNAQPLRAAVLEAPSELTPPWKWDGLLSPRLQEMVTGAPAAQVRRAVGALSWLAAVDDPLKDQLTPATDQACRWTSLQTRMEFEFRMSRLDTLLDTLLPALLGDLPPGAVGAVDLAALPLELDDHELAWFDRFLLCSSLRLPDASLQLFYEPDGGLRHGTHRRVGFLGEMDNLVAALRHRRDKLVLALPELNEVLEAFDCRALPDHDDVVDAGILLGSGCLEGRPRFGDLQADKEHTVVRRGSGDLHEAAGGLLRGLNDQRRIWHERLMESWRIGFFEDVPRLLPVVAIATPVLGRESQKAADELTAFLTRSVSGLRVLEGARGSGRLEALVTSLVNTCRDELPPRRITVISPGLDGAARFHRLWRAVAPGMDAPEMIVGSRDAVVASRFDQTCLIRGTPSPVTVVLGLEAMPSAVRFRLANRIGDQRLVAVLEPVLLQDSWEHLLPIAPDEDQMIRTGRLVGVPRLIRDDLGDIVEKINPERPLPRTESRERGLCESEPVAGLDNAMALVDSRLRDAGLEHTVELVAPTFEDLEYLGRSAARLGWLPVYSWELATLCQPGVLEFLSVLCDAAQRSDEPSGKGLSWTAELIRPESQAKFLHWLETQTTPEQSLAEFWARLSRARWAEGLFHGPRESARITNLIAAAPDESLSRYANRPLLEVWRQAVSRHEAHPGTTPSGPVLALTTPQRVGEGRVKTLAYLSTGFEADRQHYAMLSRADERLLILYQGQSPLPRDRS